jgi:hypothetical protein
MATWRLGALGANAVRRLTISDGGNEACRDEDKPISEELLHYVAALTVTAVDIFFINAANSAQGVPMTHNRPHCA